MHAMRTGGGLKEALPARTRGNYKRGIQRLPLAFAALEVPVIAAVNGPAIGAGCDLTCMCDLRIAGESARFAESFVKIGLVSGDGGAWLLPRVVGWSKAAEMALTGDMIDAAEALACGLVSQGRARCRTARCRPRARPPHRRQSALCGAHDQAAAVGRPQRRRSPACSKWPRRCRRWRMPPADHDEAVEAFLEKRRAEVQGRLTTSNVITLLAITL